MESVDRGDFAPSHQGRHVLPNDPLFGNLLRHARRDRVAIKDHDLNVRKTYGELLDAVLSFKEVVRDTLPDWVRERLSRGEEVYMGILARGGYEFTVAVLTALSLGAAIVPMCESQESRGMVHSAN